MNRVDIAGIKRALWESDKVREKIARDYDFNEEPRDQEHFASMLIGALKQEVKVVERAVENKEVFEAAVRAIGSNSRPWSTFISKEQELRAVLEDYDPFRVCKKDLTNLAKTLKTFFPGLTSSNDAQAVIMWAKKLTQYDSFYNDVILKVAKAFREECKAVTGADLRNEDLLICICGFFANPSSKRLKELGVSLGPIEDLKFNGMKYPLASEFMRNLGWNGFKPDRHIKRLLAYWFDPNTEGNSEKIALFEHLLGRKNKELREFIMFSLLGQQVSPEGMKYSEVDNLIWATGAYLIKKGEEAQYPRFIVNGP
ncbi:hypothetical protein [Brevibacillus aydinogluensis]|jgi:hypothetical protein|uniref:Uncharacterized protein n=1 Tax=Brevibacillus aydinogluensis TaxID=927786 RepID=A0AA48M6U1_9BACL|nr:hypothetical protein [Brevibacillus aydinogluensis]CAJ1002310.1 hypothetical protein BSPP4475_08285 [Brevibacillus aydinogluensis]